MLQEVRYQLQGWATNGHLSWAIRQTFHLQEPPAALKQLIDELAAGNFSSIPLVEVLDRTTMRGLNGGYTSSNPDGEERIYINREWIDTASEPQLNRTILEEFGHYIDTIINGEADTKGDEGERFAAKILGEDAPHHSATENDQHSLLINNELITIEASAPVANGNPSLTAITEDDTNPSGETIASLFNSSFTDGDDDALLAIAVTANAASTDDGNWQYSTDSGASWTSIATTDLSETNALYLSKSTRVRFLAANNFTGTPGDLTTHLIDSSHTQLSSGESIDVSIIEQDSFSTIPLGLEQGGDETPVYHFSGAATVDNKIYFAPFDEGEIGVIDSTTNSYSTISTGATSGYQYRGAVAVNDNVYFAPFNAQNIGLLNTTTASFSTISTGIPSLYKYWGAIEINNIVYFSPWDQDEIGVIDTETNTFSTISTGLTHDYKYAGAAAVNEKIYFSPFYQDNIGLLDTTTGLFSTITTGLTGNSKYAGAVAVGSNVYFAPCNQDSIGVLDTTTNSFSTISTGLTGNSKYFGAIALGHRIFFAPHAQNDIGVLDTTTNTFSTIETGLTGNNKYSSAAAVGNKVYFSPYDADDASYLQVKNYSFSDSTLSLTTSILAGNNAPTITAIASGSITDFGSSSNAIASNLSGTLSASDEDDDVLTYGIKGGSITDSKSLLKGNFGTLTVSTSTGNYVYTPNADAIGALNPGESAYDIFTVTVTDGSASDTTTYTVKIIGANESDNSEDVQVFNLYIQSKLNKIKATASLALSAEALSKTTLAALDKKEISISSKVLEMSQSLEDDQTESILHWKLDTVAPNLNLAGSNGKRSAAKKFLYHNIDDQGALSSFNYNPITRTGARLYDTDGDGLGDLVSVAHRDGQTGDLDGKSNGSLSLKTTAATIDLNPVFSGQDNGLLTLADPTDSTTAAALNLQASLSSSSNAANAIGYIILSAEEAADADTILKDLDQLKQRAVSLFSSLEASDVTLHDAFRFSRSLQLLNGQSIRFFSTADSILSDLTSLSDSRFSWLDHTINSDGSLAVSGNNNIAFSLSQQDTDPGLAALIAQQQHIAASLDFSAFTEGQTVSGTLYTAREASFDSLTGFYRTVDSQGRVLAADGSLIAPGEAGYTKAALLDSNRVTALDNLSVDDNKTKDADVSLTEFCCLAPFAKVNDNTFFAFDAANADGLSHFQALGDNLFGLEDTLGGGDLDYDDFILGFNFKALTT
ncbi:VCBS domain-containing protein [Synechococcus sp. UW140]|uniref:VCBS domain-containing protein n=1 Tax=Synechococcus sp. UW140 TaxID=368503 RepID=UPI000E0F6EC2|nr:VCBS domain-containing protein [Synechococcus sp. UW140]